MQKIFVNDTIYKKKKEKIFFFDKLFTLETQNPYLTYRLYERKRDENLMTVYKKMEPSTREFSDIAIFFTLRVRLLAVKRCVLDGPQFLTFAIFFIKLPNLSRNLNFFLFY